MICTSKHCLMPFWRYRRDFPPNGFCSLPCHALGPAKVTRPDEKPPLPDVVLNQMRHHRFHHHGTTSILGIFDCRLCEELEADYAESLSYYFSESTAALAIEAKARWEHEVSGEGAL